MFELPTYLRATILRILSQEKVQEGELVSLKQTLELRLQTGETIQTTTETSDTGTLTHRPYAVGQEVLVSPQQSVEGTVYPITDFYRVPVLGGLAIVFLLTVLVVTRKKGFFSLLSMAGSILVLVGFTVPQILAGQDPLLISLITSLLISILVVYPTHGFSKTSHVALLCMVTTLAVVSGLAQAVVELSHLTGIGNEEAVFLQFGSTANINLKGLLLGGVMLATLSVLDDSVISQISVVKQLRESNPKMKWKELFSRTMEVGKDHVSSLVNTLFLAYAGSSLPLFLLFTQAQQPLWVVLNDQLIAEEIVRTLTGSIGLVLSIPLTTFIASFVIAKKSMK
jgi:uncharacterized membrane protein